MLSHVNKTIKILEIEEYSRFGMSCKINWMIHPDILQILPSAVSCQQNNQNLGDNPEVDNNVQFLWSSPKKLEALVASIDRPISVEYSTKVRQPTTTHCTLSHIGTTASVSFFLLRRGTFKIRNELRIWTIHPDILLQNLPNDVNKTIKI